MSHAPDWVLNAVCATVAERYVVGNLPIEAFANKTAKLLSASYSDVTGEKLYGAAEAMLFFLAEIEEDEPIGYLASFVYNSVTLDRAGRPRKLKGLFYNPLAPAREGTSSKAVLLAFRAFVFRMRNDRSLAKPREWSMANIPELSELNRVITVDVVFADAM